MLKAGFWQKILLEAENFNSVASVWNTVLGIRNYFFNICKIYLSF